MYRDGWYTAIGVDAVNRDSYSFFNGLIDEVEIYDYALTPEQVKALYDPVAGSCFNKYCPTLSEVSALDQFHSSYLNTIHTGLNTNSVTNIRKLSETRNVDIGLNEQAQTFFIND